MMGFKAICSQTFLFLCTADHEEEFFRRHHLKCSQAFHMCRHCFSEFSYADNLICRCSFFERCNTPSRLYSPFRHAALGLNPIDFPFW